MLITMYPEVDPEIMGVQSQSRYKSDFPECVLNPAWLNKYSEACRY